MKKFKRSECFITKPKYQHLETDLVPHNSLSICWSTGPTPGGNGIIMGQNDTEPSEPSRTVHHSGWNNLPAPAAALVLLLLFTAEPEPDLLQQEETMEEGQCCRSKVTTPGSPGYPGTSTVNQDDQVSLHHRKLVSSLPVAAAAAAYRCSISLEHPGPIWRSEPTESCSLMVKTRNMQRRKLLLN